MFVPFNGGGGGGIVQVVGGPFPVYNDHPPRGSSVALMRFRGSRDIRGSSLDAPKPTTTKVQLNE